LKKVNEIFRFYSQYGEDFLLWEFFDYKKTGFFIDVGAFDGIHLSNTYSFELKGWEGICVEPQPSFFDLCKVNRLGSLCINAACTGREDIPDINFEADTLGLFSSIKLDKNAPNIVGHYGLLGLKEIEHNNITVKALTLNSILLENLKNNLEIDFVSIDVEGFEIDVLRGFDLIIYRPRILLIETNTENVKKEINSYLDEFGYRFARQVGVNSFYVCNDDDLRKLRGISLNCVIEKQTHPRGIKYTIEEFANGKVIREGKNLDDIIKENERLKNYENLVVQYKGFIKKRDREIDDLNAVIVGYQKKMVKFDVMRKLLKRVIGRLMIWTQR
jgi:FkbM family methyltransferase